MEEQIPITEEQAVNQVEEQPVEQEVEPTKNIKNFWERLDEVFSLTVQNSKTREQMEQLIEQFPEVAKINQQFSSALFQPERISLCSNDDIQPSSQVPGVNEQTQPYRPDTGHYPSEMFSNFRIRLQRPLRNVKSLQLLSATIPNATTNIPDSQTFFWWYKLRNVNDSVKGAWNGATTYIPGDIVTFLGGTFVCILENTNSQPVGVQIGVGWIPTTLPTDLTRPNYYDLNPYHLYYVYLAPTYFFPNDYLNNEPNYFNRTFQDYQDVVDALNFCMSQAQGNNNQQLDISFQYDATLNKIIMIPSATELSDGFYYLPCGYEDQNIPLFMQEDGTDPHFVIYFGGTTGFPPSQIYFTPQSTLNTRLGFTWNGRFPNVFTLNNPWADPSFYKIFYWYMRKTDPVLTASVGAMITEKVTANNYADLVNTSCVRVYADFTFGSTQDSLGSTNDVTQPIREGLLSIVPVNTTNLGIGFYQNNFNNPLTKIPKNITEIGITLLTDQGLPFYLPNSATVLLELAVEYI